MTLERKALQAFAAKERGVIDPHVDHRPGTLGDRRGIAIAGVLRQRHQGIGCERFVGIARPSLASIFERPVLERTQRRHDHRTAIWGEDRIEPERAVRVRPVTNPSPAPHHLVAFGLVGKGSSLHRLAPLLESTDALASSGL